MRTLSGTIELPADAPKGRAEQIVVEVRDVSVADAPSVVVAATQLSDISIEPGGRVPFELEVPEVESRRALSLRVHVSLQGTPGVQAGDLVTTASKPVATSGALSPTTVPVKLA